ncbi:MAG: hypothetical protein KDA44_08835 [Planctomycetales bacterium]|nr:hypothetical protein [Planctomycetales bacterium]
MICDVCNAEVDTDSGTRVPPERFRELLDAGFGFDNDNVQMLVDSGMSQMQARMLLRQQYLQSASDWLLCEDCVCKANDLLEDDDFSSSTSENVDSNDVTHEAQSTSVNHATGWWRWPLVPLAAIAGSTVGSTLVGMIGWAGAKTYGGFAEDGWYYLYIMPTIMSGFLGFIWSTASAYVAPYAKFITAVVMSTVLGMIGVFLLMEHFGRPECYSTPPILMLAYVIAMIVGAVVASMQVAEAEKNG